MCRRGAALRTSSNRSTTFTDQDQCDGLGSWCVDYYCGSLEGLFPLGVVRSTSVLVSISLIVGCADQPVRRSSRRLVGRSINCILSPESTAIPPVPHPIPCRQRLPESEFSTVVRKSATTACKVLSSDLPELSGTAAADSRPGAGRWASADVGRRSSSATIHSVSHSGKRVPRIF